MIDGLTDKVREWTEKTERDFIDSTIRILEELMDVWVQIVLDSATKARQAPLDQIVADGKSVGWRRWGKLGSSLERLRSRLETFKQAVIEARRQQVEDIDRGRL